MLPTLLRRLNPQATRALLLGLAWATILGAGLFVATCHTQPTQGTLSRRARHQAEAAVHGYLQQAARDSAAAAAQLALATTHLVQARAWADSATAAHEASLLAGPADSVALRRFFADWVRAHPEARR